LLNSYELSSSGTQVTIYNEKHDSCESICEKHVYTINVTYSTFSWRNCSKYVINVYPYEKHMKNMCLHHMQNIWDNFLGDTIIMFLRPYVKHVCHIRLTSGAFLPVYVIVITYHNYYSYYDCDTSHR
jgi:hypothetical protein